MIGKVSNAEVAASGETRGYSSLVDSGGGVGKPWTRPSMGPACCTLPDIGHDRWLQEELLGNALKPTCCFLTYVSD